LGLTRISFWSYLLATWIFMLPGGFAYTWLGYLGREAATGSASLVQNLMIGVALLAMVALLPRMVNRFRGDKSGIDDSTREDS